MDRLDTAIPPPTQAQAEEKATEALDRVKDANVALGKSSNLLREVMVLRDAIKAHEDLEYSGYKMYNRMPLERDMIELSGGLYLCSAGTIWLKKMDSSAITSC